MGRSRLSLLPLARSLRREGHETTLFGYSVAFNSFEENANRLLDYIRESTHGARYGIVAHSLGGILTRSISGQLPPGWEKFVMLGPPNRPVTMAKKLENHFLYRKLTGSSGQRLSDPAFYEQLPIPEVPTLIVAGDRGRSDHFSPFGGAPNDGIVSVEETRLPGAVHLVVPMIHTLIMNDRRARTAIKSFLEDSPHSP